MAEGTEQVTGVDGGVVVGLDGSSGARAALREAAREASSHGLELHVLRAWTMTSAPDVPSWGQGYVPSHVELEEAVRAEVAHDVEAVLGPEPGCVVHVHAVRGSASKRMIEASQSAALVVVGSRGRGGFAGLLLGSTSEQLVRFSRCPVLVVPDRRDARPD